MKACPDSPRKRVKEWIHSGRFFLEGRVVTDAGLRMEDPGDRLRLGQPDSAVASWTHRKRVHPKLMVLHLDSDLAIVDKGAGLLSVPSRNQAGESVLDVLGRYLIDSRGEENRRRLFGRSGRPSPLPVHRLDQYTSGLLCLALNEAAREHLIGQLRERSFIREYIAYCDGVPAETAGSWRHFLKLDPSGYFQSLHADPVAGAVEAVTHYTLEQVFRRHRVSRLRIRLETGLKHQIRIQAGAVGLPLIGDRRYHKATRDSLERKGAPLPYGFRRQALHASVIGIRHPSTGKVLQFASRVPSDLEKLEQRLRD